MNIQFSIILVVMAGFLAIAYALYKGLWIYRLKVDNENLKRISKYIAEGAMAFLRREYRVLFPFVLCVSAFLFFINKNELRWESLAFVFGAVCSALAGYVGMKVATAANSRTASAARKSLNDALQVAFSGGRDRKSTRLNSSHIPLSRMPSSA